MLLYAIDTPLGCANLWTPLHTLTNQLKKVMYTNKSRPCVRENQSKKSCEVIKKLFASERGVHIYQLSVPMYTMIGS